MVQLIEDTVIIEKTASLRVSFSLSLGLGVSVSDEIAQNVCGACGSDAKLFDVQRQSVEEYMALWRASDFPSALC